MTGFTDLPATPTGADAAGVAFGTACLGTRFDAVVDFVDVVPGFLPLLAPVVPVLRVPEALFGAAEPAVLEAEAVEEVFVLLEAEEEVVVLLLVVEPVVADFLRVVLPVLFDAGFELLRGRVVRFAAGFPDDGADDSTGFPDSFSGCWAADSVIIKGVFGSLK